LYGGAIARRNRRFDRGIGVERVDRPVISIGNVTVGGVGKSPMVAWVVDRLLEQSRRPVIAMRGYGAVGGEPSDEQAEYAMRCPGVDVVADPDRVAALGAYLPEHDDVDCVVLDDGFQHRRLHRDLDLVLIDASRRTLGDRLLPAGSLREPLACLGRCDAVVVTRAEAFDSALQDKIERWHGRPPVAWSRHAWTGLHVHQGDSPSRQEPVAWLKGRRVLTLLGVGHPRAIERQLESHGATIAASVPAADHERYDHQKVRVVRGLCGGVDGVVVTGKDWVKLRHLIESHNWPIPFVVPELRIDVFRGHDALLELILNRVNPA
jgi:tetraacyldisaccharide 4'-kinase